ncbi:hypothetical protein MJG53_005632 [Ovis ammon polii x Ovis aries]|uniref:Uncharacterized protein n=1 Tax=Ovis ammon polii x Ovis aries TaxID=2918886 RepID=A0ACB9V6Y0_9CETA|nr:hypothetical protein MJG53_005632 [Ovis ammon polii x Ovis aries]
MPLSSAAQKIMSAMRSGGLVGSENWRGSEKSNHSRGIHYSSSSTPESILLFRSTPSEDVRGSVSLQSAADAVQKSSVKCSALLEDGKTQSLEKEALVPSVRGIVMLLRSHPEEGSSPLTAPASSAPEDTPSDQCIYMKAEHSPIWGQEQEARHQFAKNVLLEVLKCKRPVICFNAKDFVRTALQLIGDDGGWKCVADFVGLDPRIAAWLIDPTDAAPSFEDLVAKYLGNPTTLTVNSTDGSSSRKAVLFRTLELPLIPILAVMESHRIRVNKEEMERTSALLGSRLKELEREAHFVAGERFLITSNHQLREILFGKLRLHLLCPQDTLPTTGLRRLPSTSEAVVHKLKSTFVDGLLACMKKRLGGQHVGASTWHQNLNRFFPTDQGRRILHVEPDGHRERKAVSEAPGDEDELSISPRTAFVSSEGRSFLAAGSPDRFVGPGPWAVNGEAGLRKDISPERVTHADREQTKKVVYAVVYGAGKDRLAACLGVPAQEAAQFLESFLQKYKKIKDFTQATIARCQQTGYVESIMGRRRPLPRIRAHDPQLRAQAERQAVNFVVQGSAADLCKMAMIRVFTAVATSPTLTARLLAQIHDELLFEVEDSQLPEFTGAPEGEPECGPLVGTPGAPAGGPQPHQHPAESPSNSWAPASPGAPTPEPAFFAFIRSVAPGNSGEERLRPQPAVRPPRGRSFMRGHRYLPLGPPAVNASGGAVLTCVNPSWGWETMPAALGPSVGTRAWAALGAPTGQLRSARRSREQPAAWLPGPPSGPTGGSALGGEHGPTTLLRAGGACAQALASRFSQAPRG